MRQKVLQGRQELWPIHLFRQSKDELRRRFENPAIDVDENVHENKVCCQQK